jgi:pilus assembly protein CpaB
MRLRTLVLILVAAGCGLVAAVLVSQHLGGGPTVIAASAEKIKVLYAKQTIPGYVPIDKPEEMFEIREVTKDEIRDGIGEFEKVKGRVLRIPLARGKPLAESDLYGPNEIIGITVKLKPGERPMTVKVTPLTGTAGFIRPGDRVDIIASARVREQSKAKMILQDIEVLAIDQSVQTENQQVARPADLVTLRVNPQQAEQLAAYADNFTLRLVPRRPDDNEIVDSQGQIADLERRPLNSQPREEPKDEEEPAKPAPVKVVEAPAQPAQTGQPRAPGAGKHKIEVMIGDRRVEQTYTIKDKRDADEGKK